jgi:hypothetical protein
MKLYFAFLLLMVWIVFGYDSPPEPTLIGGQIAQKDDFPEMIYISSGRSRCSAAIVSGRVILTAAHCIENQGEIFPADFVVNQQAFRAVCTHHPEYASKYSFDFALCKTKKDIDVKPASIGSEPVSIGQQITLTGYGCTQPRKPDGSQDPGGNDGKLRYGLSPVTRLPENSPAGGYQYFYTESNTALCFGDSGGPAMQKILNPKVDKHIIVGTNSRGNIRTLSLLSSTFLPGFRSWAEAYAIANEVEICGINKDCGSKPSPKCSREKQKIKEWQKRLEQCQQSDAETTDDIFEL